MKKTQQYSARKMKYLMSIEDMGLERSRYLRYSETELRKLIKHEKKVRRLLANAVNHICGVCTQPLEQVI